MNYLSIDSTLHKRLTPAIDTASVTPKRREIFTRLFVLFIHSSIHSHIELNVNMDTLKYTKTFSDFYYVQPLYQIWTKSEYFHFF